MWVHMTPASLQLDLQRQLLYLQSLSLLSHGAAEYAAAANVARWPARHLKSSWPMLDIPVSAVGECPVEPSAQELGQDCRITPVA